MGMKNGPAIFQRVMDHILQALDCADVYIEDIIIGSSSETEEKLLANPDRDVRAALDRLEKGTLLLRLAKPISLCVRLNFVAMCWKMAHAGRRQGKCWRLNVRKNRIMFGTSEGSWGSQTIIRVMSKPTPP